MHDLTELPCIMLTILICRVTIIRQIGIYIYIHTGEKGPQKHMHSMQEYLQKHSGQYMKKKRHLLRLNT